MFYNTFPEKDEEIRDIINRLWFVLPEQLGLDSTAMDDSIYYSAQRGSFLHLSTMFYSLELTLATELSGINAFISPREKIECLLNCSRILNCMYNPSKS